MIRYVVGDATRPELTLTRMNLIVHIVNDVGAFGRGFVLPLARAYPLAKSSYKYWYEHRLDPRTETSDPEFELGSVKFVRVADRVEVAHMIAQHGIRTSPPPINYGALERCLDTVAQYARERDAYIHMPRIGCGLSGGTWDRVEQIVEKTLSFVHLTVTVYDLPER